ncbi:hypothetical protein [Phytohabitans kaempferiae]|uniref:Adhesin domain-containing protein n=1 Tax=Phytohabitans kaempferiae TaxID=1620943 RepID=A0ABV6MGF0_9ACTN
MTAQPGERMLSWLDEDDPNRGVTPFEPVEAAIELAPTDDTSAPKKKSRREKPPKPPKPQRERRWRRDRSASEEPVPDEVRLVEWAASLNQTPLPEWGTPPGDEPPAAPSGPAAATGWDQATAGAPAGLAAARGERNGRPERRTVPRPQRDGAAGERVPQAPPSAARPVPAPRRPADDAPPAPPRAVPAPADAWQDGTGPATRADWFTPRDSAPGDADSPDAVSYDGPGYDPEPYAAGAPDAVSYAPAPEAYDAAPGGPAPHGAALCGTGRHDPGRDGARDTNPQDARPENGWNEERPRDTASEAPARPDWLVSPVPASDDRWTTTPTRDANERPEWAVSPGDRRSAGPGRDANERPARAGAPRDGWVTTPAREPAPDGGRTLTPPVRDRGRPEWVTPPAEAPVDEWSGPPRESDPPEAWPAPLDITPDDDLAEPRGKGGRPPRGPRGGPGRPAGRRRRPLLVLAVALTGAIMGVAVFAVATMYRQVVDGDGLSHTIAAPVNGRSEAELELASGAAAVTVRSTDLGDDLFQVTTPDDDEAVPRATIQGNRVTVRMTSSDGEGATAVEVRLNTRVTWQLVFSGGADRQTVDLSGGKLSGLEMPAGATRLELTLPKPEGTVPIRLGGGLDELLLHAPAGVHTRVKAVKGATNVTLDRLNRSRVAPDTTFTPNGWDQAKARYDVTAAQGVGTLKLDRR